MENLLNFPQSSMVDKLIPKAKFVRASDTPSSTRDFLSKEIEQIRLLYIIREDTINVNAGEQVQEIDIFFIRMKEDHYELNLLSTLDTLIPRHTIYLIHHGSNLDVLMQHKQRGVVQGIIKWKIITSELLSKVNLEGLNLHIEGNNLDNIYINLLSQISKKHLESIEDYTNQKNEDERIAKLKKKISMLENQARRETQPRRKFALVQEINKLKDQL